MTSTELRVIVSVPTAGVVPIGFAASLVGLFSYIAANHIKTMPEASLTVAIDLAASSNWITNREQLARRAVDKNYTHMLVLDDDMVFAPNILDIMMGRRQSIVCTNYLIKTDPPAKSPFVAVSLEGERIPTKRGDTGLVPIAYSGFGVSLFEVEVLRKVPQPWFMPDFSPEKSEYTTEDNPFYRKAREAGFKVYLDQDASQLVSHIGQYAWNWEGIDHG